MATTACRSSESTTTADRHGASLAPASSSCFGRNFDRIVALASWLASCMGWMHGRRARISVALHFAFIVRDCGAFVAGGMMWCQVCGMLVVVVVRHVVLCDHSSICTHFTAIFRFYCSLAASRYPPSFPAPLHCSRHIQLLN